MWGRKGGYNSGGNWRHKKLDMSKGTNPNGWFLQAEKFFSFYGLSKTKKLEAIVVAMEGDDFIRCQWENKRHLISS